MVRRWGWVVVSAATLVTLAACGSDSKSDATSPGSAATTSAAATTLAPVSSTPSSDSGPSTSGTFEVASSAPLASVPEGLESAVDIAVADLAGRLAVDAGKVVTVTARNVTWPDGAIGCPQPGMMYTQVQVDGAEIVLEVDGISYRYTLGGSKGPTLCTTG